MVHNLVSTVSPIIYTLDVNVTQPSFTHSVGGYSSFLALPLGSPTWVARGFDAQFHLSSPNTDQVRFTWYINTAFDK